MLKHVFVTAAALVVMATPAAGQTPADADRGRPCVAGDVAGLWESRVVTVAESGSAEHYALAPYDYIRFEAPGGMMYFGSPTRRTDLRDIRSTLDRLDKDDGVTYTWRIVAEGVVLILRDNEPFQGFACAMVANGGPSAGGKPAMVWTNLPQMPALRRVQVRLD